MSYGPIKKKKNKSEPRIWPEFREEANHSVKALRSNHKKKFAGKIFWILPFFLVALFIYQILFFIRLTSTGPNHYQF